MKIVLELNNFDIRPVSNQFRDNHHNIKTTNYLVWDVDGVVRFAVHDGEKFCYAQNKKEIKDMLWWAELPGQI